MKNRTIIMAIGLGLILTMLVPAVVPQLVWAQGCTDARGNPIECPPDGSGGGGGKKKPTPSPYPSYTPTFTPTLPPSVTPVASLTPTAVLPLPIIPGGDGPPPPASGFPGGLGWLFGMIIVVGLGGGLFLLWRRLNGDGSDEGRESPTKPPNPNIFGRESPTKPGGDGSDQGIIVIGGKPGTDKMEAQPHMVPAVQFPGEDGSDQGIIVIGGKPGGDGSVKGFIIEGGKPGMDGANQGFDVFKPGGEGSDQGFDTEMQPGETPPPEGDVPPPDADIPSDGGIDDPNIKPPDVGLDNPNI